MRRAWILVGVAVTVLVVLVGAWVVVERRAEPAPITVEANGPAPETVLGALVVPEPAPRTLHPYGGYGTWVDVFDYSPPYAGSNPSVTPAELQRMAELGVRTVYLQAARLDDRSPEGLEDRWLLAQFLFEAEEAGIDVVAWYLPRFGPDLADRARLDALADFSVLGRRFDGVAVDIEWTGDDVDDETRSARLVELGADLIADRPDLPLGGIVLPPVLIEVVNPDYWPGFPWAEIADQYDVWLPMSYWSFRSDASGYGDGYAYHEESVRRLRTNLGDPDALVHGIGGIGGVDGIDDPLDPEEPLATLDELRRFVDALVDTGSIGGSVYDWATLDEGSRALLADVFTP